VDISDVESDEDDFMPSLMERLASRSGASSVSVTSLGENSTSSADVSAKPAPKRKPATKATKAKAKAPVKDVYELDSPSPTIAPKAKTVRKVSPVPMRKTSARTSKKKVVIESDSELSDMSEDEYSEYSDGGSDFEDDDSDFE
jgi:hypothetical protein